MSIASNLTEEQIARLRKLRASEGIVKPIDSNLIAMQLVAIVDDDTVDITSRGRGALALAEVAR